MIHTVKKSTHRFLPSLFGLSVKKKIRKDVCFLVGCEYNIDKDQTDINKVWGVGFLPHHHVHYARFGWVWNPDKMMVEVYAYYYDKGQRKSEWISDVNRGEIVRLELDIHPDHYIFAVRHRYSRYRYTLCKVTPSFKLIGYKLGPFFGGNRTAPHEMKLLIK